MVLANAAMVALNDDRVVITLANSDQQAGAITAPTTLNVAAVRVRRGHDIRLIVKAPMPAIPKRDERLVALVADAVVTRDRLQAIGDVSIAKAAAWFGCCRSTLTDRIKLSYLAPDIVEAILAGRQPRSLTRRRLTAIDLPIDWRHQRALLGFS